MMLINKTAWWVRTDEDWPSTWSRKVLKKIMSVLDEYQSRVVMSIHQGKEIQSLFESIYKKEIMSKVDYYLSDDYLRQSFIRMEQNEEYRLLWFKTVEGEVIGGNIVRLVPGLAKGVYRAYSHELQYRLGLLDFDYYADFRVQEYVRDCGYREFSRGTLNNPCPNLGTTLFKLKTGCYPKAPINYVMSNVTNEQIERIANETGACLVYDHPDESKKFCELRVTYKQGCMSELINSITKLSERIGIKVSMRQL